MLKFFCKNNFMYRALSLFLVCVMAWNLIPHADALEPICGLEEHVHGEACYAIYGDEELNCTYAQLIHVHDGSCWDSGGNLTCGMADFVIHQHDDTCRDADGNLICGLPEIHESVHELDFENNLNIQCVYENYFRHEHGDACYETREILICDEDASEIQTPHEHADACYVSELTCDITDESDIGTGDAGTGDAEIGDVGTGDAETGDVGTGDAVTDDAVTSGVEPGDGDVMVGGSDSEDLMALAHVHDSDCYSRVLVCDKVFDMAPGHVHDADCYTHERTLTCDIQEDIGTSDSNSGSGSNICHHYRYETHTHGSECRDGNGNFICGKLDLKAHAHNSNCFTREITGYGDELTCNRDEHKHGITCYFRDKTEELDAFLEAYDTFMQQVNSEDIDMSDAETQIVMAKAAWQVKQLSANLDKDVLKLESIQEMLANLEKYIPEGFVPDETTNPDVLDGALFAVEPKIALDIVAPLEEQSLRCDISVDLIDSHGAVEPDFSAWPFVIRDGDLSSIPVIKFFAAGEYDLKFTMTGSSDNAILDTRAWNVKIIATMAADNKTVDTPVVSYKQDVDGSEVAETMKFMVRPSGNTMKKYSSAVKSQAREIMAGMTTEQLAGQMLLPHFSGNAGGYGIDYSELISQYHVGGLILFDADTQNRNPTTLKALLDDAQAKGKAANHNIGMLISVDEEGGRRSDGGLINRVSNWPQYGHSPFVSSKEMYEAGGFRNIYNCEVDKGEFLTGLGFNMNHGPVLDLAKTGYVSGRSFSDNGFETAPYAVNSIRGLHDGGVGISMKHFPGYGNTSANTHNGWVVNDLDENAFQYNELVPFYAGMAAGGDTIMVTHNSITWLDAANKHCASCNPAVYQLARDMGFEGITMTDDLNMKAITDEYGSGAVAAINAGADIALTGNYNDLQAVQDAVASGVIPMSRVQESVERILCWKIEHGLIEFETEPDVPVPGDAEAMYIGADGSTQTGDLKAMFSLTHTNGGTVKLLKDVYYNSSTGLRAQVGDVVFDLNGHVLDLGWQGHFSVKGTATSFVIMDSVMESMASDILTSSSAKLPAFNSAVQVDGDAMTAVWYNVADDGTGVRRELDLSKCGRITGTHMSDSFVHVRDTVKADIEFRSGVMTGDGDWELILIDSTADSRLLMSGGWIFSVNATGSKAGVIKANDVTFTGGGIVGAACAFSDLITSPTLKKDGKLVGPYRNISGAYIIGCRSTGSLLNIKISDELVSDTALNISNSEFIGNRGGVVFTKNVDVQISDSVFAFNNSDITAGMVVIESLTEPCSVAGSKFYHNMDSAMVFRNLTDATNVANVSGCEFVGNQSPNDGGAIRFYGDGTVGYTGRHVVSDCTFRDNRATKNGGAIATLGGSMNALPPTMVLELRNCDFENCVSSSGFGGAVYFNDARMFMSDVTSKDCKGSSGDSMRISRENATSTISGLLDFNTPVSRLQHESYFFAGADLNLASNILVGLSYEITDNDAVIVCTAAEGVDLSDKAKCFVPVDSGFKTWYDSSRNCIMYGTLAHETGEAGVGISGVALQYYAYVEIADNVRTDVNSYQLPTIDTSADTGGGSGMKFNGSAYLPQESQVSPGQYAGVWPTRNVYLANPDGSVLTADSRLRVRAHTTMSPIYRSKLFGDAQEVNAEVVNENAVQGDSLEISALVGKKLSSMNRFVADDGVYDVTEIWVSKPDVSLTSVSKADFDVHAYTDDLFLTADEAVAAGNPNAILLRSNQAIRFVAEPVMSERGMHTIFYDYDISNGTPIGTYQNEHTGIVHDKYNTAAAGINSFGNYKNNGLGKFAFGNANMDVSWMADKHNGRPMNQANREGNWKEVKSECFKYCAFGIVTGLDSDGNLIWASDVDHQNLFNDGDATGKTVYANSELVFERKGNVYTLDTVRGYDSDSPSLPAGKSLQEFGSYSSVLANNFWPMDTVPSYGTAGHDPMFGVKETVVNHTNMWWPTSDDLTNHNSYFGMYFQVSFNLIEDYVAPMSYQFFGDDDMWVFLDGQLICDVGGVHYSAGQYVNLRDYLPADESSNGEHTLTVYYIERGASGSSCWMQMHLPNPLRVSTEVPPDSKLTGDLAVTKRVSGIDTTDETFGIKIDLTDDKGKAVSGSFEYVGFDGSVGSIQSGDVVYVKQDSTVTVKKIPFGTHVRLSEELDSKKYWNLDVEQSVVNAVIGLGVTEMEITNHYTQYGELRISKSVVDENMNVIPCNANFAFDIKLRDESGNVIQNQYYYEIYPIGTEPGTDSPVATGYLSHGMNPALLIPGNCILYAKNIPDYISFEIQELALTAESQGYGQVSAENNIGILDRDLQVVEFVNAPVESMPELPRAGGLGTDNYLIAGTAFICLACLVITRKKISEAKA